MSLPPQPINPNSQAPPEMWTSPCTALQRGILPLVKQMQQTLLISWDKERWVVELKKAEHFHIIPHIPAPTQVCLPQPSNPRVIKAASGLGTACWGCWAQQCPRPEQQAWTHQGGTSKCSFSSFHFSFKLIKLYLFHHLQNHNKTCTKNIGRAFQNKKYPHTSSNLPSLKDRKTTNRALKWAEIFHTFFFCICTTSQQLDHKEYSEECNPDVIN